MDPLLLHVDMDAFFAACEELRHPEHKGRPLIVGAKPDEFHGRGVVISCTYAARAFGVRSAMPVREAARRCPDAAYVRPDHAHYVEVSRRIFSGLADEFPVEQASIDEAYVDASSLTTWDKVRVFAARVAQRVQAQSGGLECSIGVGPNKLVAKIATDHQKPRGLTIVPPDGVQAFLDKLPARRIPGIGPKTTERLHAIGIETVQDLRTFSPEDLRSALGDHASDLQRLARGEGSTRIHTERERRKSMSEERTFSSDTNERRLLLRSLRRMVDSLESDLARRRYAFRHVALKVRFQDFETHTKQAGARRPMSDTTLARRVLPRLLDEFLEDGRRVRLVGVRFGDLEPVGGQQTLGDFGTPKIRLKYTRL